MSENSMKYSISTQKFWEATLEKSLSLCQGPQFPRTISTFKTKGGQVEVSSIEGIHQYFEASNFVDCRINAYPKVTNYDGINLQPPTLIM